VREPWTRVLFRLALYCGLRQNQGLYPNGNSHRIAIAFGRDDCNGCLFYFLDVRKAHVLIGGYQNALVRIAVSDYSRVFNAIFWPFAVYAEYLCEALNAVSGLFELLWMNSCSESFLQK
jgi:hypothetical protein